nr:uncharacterized protein LOC110004421 isoform X2 [Labrus bergylta]
MQQLHMLVFSLVLFWISHPVNALETVYGAEGDDIVLTPPLQSPSPSITSIQWKHGEDMVAEWYEVYGTETYCLTKFKGRCKLNRLTGALTITGLTKTDSGSCKPEINNKYLDSTHLIVISRVPKPSVSESCNTEMTACNLTCEGNTIESEPVDCKWLLDEAVGPSGKVLTITKEMKEQSYRCVFVNPVGNKTSDIMTNPLLKENVHLVRIRWLIAAAGVLLFFSVLGVAAYLIYKRRTARGSYGFVPTKEEDNNVIKVHVPPTTQDSDSLCNGSVIPEEQRASNEPSDSIPLQSVCNGAVIPEEQRASNEPSDSIPLQSVCNGAGSYKSVPTKEEDNNVEVHVPPTTQDSDSLCNGSVIPEEQRASNEPSDSIPLQSVCNGAGSYKSVPTKEEDNNVIEVHVPPTTQDSDSLCNGSVIPEEQRASNEPSDSIPLQNVCNGAGKASEISSNNDLTTSTSPEAGKEADITSEMGPESPQDSITPETGKETEITSDVVEKSDENSTTPASPASSQETGDLATKPPDQEQTNQEPPAAEQEADDAGDLDEH